MMLARIDHTLRGYIACFSALPASRARAEGLRIARHALAAPFGDMQARRAEPLPGLLAQARRAARLRIKRAKRKRT